MTIYQPFNKLTGFIGPYFNSKKLAEQWIKKHCESYVDKSDEFFYSENERRLNYDVDKFIVTEEPVFDYLPK